MTDSPWLVMRQAEEAVANHMPEDAHRLLEPLIAEGYRKASRLAREVVKAYIARAAKFLDQENADAAWQDLIAAESLNTGEKAIAELRQTLARLGLIQARGALESGHALDALVAVGRLRERGVRHPDLARLERAAQDWRLAIELADRGEFLRAIAELDKLRSTLPCPANECDNFRAEMEKRHARFRAAIGKLYDAAEARLWRDALNAAEEVLAAAPEHREAQAIRGKAWLAAAPPEENGRNADGVKRGGSFAATLPHTIRESSSTLSQSAPTHVPTSDPTSLPKRFLMWVDGVGGYLVCLSNRVTFGQATADGPVDVPLFADVSRLHAELSRDGEGYILESAKGLLVNGKVATRSVLAAGDRVTLGATCQFLFHKPVSVSSTARLELTSGHRLPVAVEGVLLMGNELILGPGPQAHIILPGVDAPLLIYRSKEGLGIRVPASPFRIDDRVCHDRAPLPLPSVVTADTFTFAVEPVSGRL